MKMIKTQILRLTPSSPPKNAKKVDESITKHHLLYSQLTPLTTDLRCNMIQALERPRNIEGVSFCQTNTLIRPN